MVQPSDKDRQIDYIEFGATDLPSLRSFYEQAFSWKFEDWGPDYISFDDGRLTGGFTTQTKPVAGGALVVLYAVDIEGVQRAVEVAGGTVTRPIFTFPGGRRFHFSDPDGNELAVWSDR